MTVQRRGISKTPESSAIEKKIKRGNAQRQASSWRGNVITLLLLTGVTGLVSWIYFTWADDFTHTMVSRGEILTQPRVLTVECSEDYKKYKFFPGCTPTKCGRAITDSVVTLEEAQKLRRLAERGLSLAGSDGGASILDLHSGALSMGKQFVNIYRDVRSRIQKIIAENFGLDSKQMYLTKPTFFSRINSTSAKTTHDEYWHPHIDKETYGSFDYTSLLYLSDYGLEFGGGRFVFMDPSSNRTVEPRADAEGHDGELGSVLLSMRRVSLCSYRTRHVSTTSVEIAGGPLLSRGPL
uniref:Urotensin-2 receptor 2 n=1 Tax=Cyprinus carpio TaxID=7962 RepID=A0A8C2HVY7_CYPCA